jgi:hypothetical protein
VSISGHSTVHFRTLTPDSGRKLWYGVVARASPGVAAEDAPDSEEESLEGSVLEDGLTGILATGGCEATGGRGIGRDAHLIEAYGENQKPRQGFGEKPEEGCHSASRSEIR